MPRERLTRGTAGRIRSKKNPATGKWQARARYRDALGGYASASATAITRTQAEVDLRIKLNRLTSSTVTHGVGTVGELCEQWLEMVVSESEAFWALPDAAIRRVLRTSRDLAITRETAVRLDALLVVLLGTAMRVGEATALRWSDLVLAGHDPTVTITGTRVEVAGKGTYRQDVPKTAAGNRTLLLPPAVVDAFLGLRPERWQRDDFVFVTKNGTMWNSGNAVKVLKLVVAAAQGELDPHRVRFHKLRSTAATAIQRRYGTEVAGQVLGHKGTGVTRLYYVAKPEIAPDVRDVLQELVESSERVAEGRRRTPAARRHLRVV